MQMETDNSLYDKKQPMFNLQRASNMVQLTKDLPLACQAWIVLQAAVLQFVGRTGEQALTDVHPSRCDTVGLLSHFCWPS